MADLAGDETLVQAYAAKRSEEAQAAAQLFTAPAMQSVYDRAADACATLARTLDSLATPWLFGAEPGMADLSCGAPPRSGKDAACTPSSGTCARPGNCRCSGRR